MSKAEQVADKQPSSERNSTEGESAHNAGERLLSESAESPGTTTGDQTRNSNEQEPFASKEMTDLGFPQVEIAPAPLPSSAEATSTNGARQRDATTPSQPIGRENSASADGPAPPQQGPITPRETGELIAPPRAPGSGGDQPRDNSPAQGPTAPESPQSTDSGPRTA